MIKKTMYFISLVLAVAIVVNACKPKDDKNHGIDLGMIDTTKNPGEDFYQFAVGKWLDTVKIPGEKSRYGTFAELMDKNEILVKEIILDAAKKAGTDKKSTLYKVGTFYKTGMDTAKIEADGIKYLQPELDRINNMKDKDDLFAELAHIQLHTSTPLFYFYVTADAKNSSMNAAHIYQGGTSLPDRDYYLEDNDDMKDKRAKFVEHVTKMYTLMGCKDAAKKAEELLKFETKLAKAQWTRVELRDPIKRYNKFDTDKLDKMMGSFDLKTFIKGLEIEVPEFVIVGQPSYVEAVGKLVKSEDLDTWKNYLTWKVINSNAHYLPKDFVMQDFDFYTKTLHGVKEIKPRWKRVLGTTNGALGEAVGQLFVEKHFTPEAKEKALTIVNSLLASLKERISDLDWMGKETKEKALAKLAKFRVKIGYPDKWRDYSGLEVTKESYVKNAIASNYFDSKFELEKIGKPVDKEEWGMTPQTVNAYYHPVNNEIVFPAGILQPPYFDPLADDAANYGAMGVVIGHEITHGFDDQGRMYDADGKLSNWWTDQDSENFLAKAKGLIDQFNSFEALEGQFVNGELTQGENIADLGGLAISYNAYKKTAEFKENKPVNGYTPTQRFYISYAQIWKSKIRDEALKVRLKTDVHSPAYYRVLGPLPNIPDFYEAFNIKETDKMALKPEQRVKIW